MNEAGKGSWLKNLKQWVEPIGDATYFRPFVMDV